MSGLNWLDYTLVGIIGISGLVGLIRGLIREVFSLISWGVAVWISFRYSREMAPHLEALIALPPMRFVAAFGLLFLGSLIVTGMISSLISTLLRSVGLTGIDRFAGLLFGGMRGVLLVSLLILLASATPLPDEPLWKTSKLIPTFRTVALWLRNAVYLGYTHRNGWATPSR